MNLSNQDNMKSFKKVGRRVVISHASSIAIYENSEERKGCTKLENYVSSTFHMVSPSFADYSKGNRPKDRLVIVMIIKLAQALFILRYGMSVIFNKNHFIRVVLMADANHLSGQPILMSVVLCLGHITISTVSIVILWLEYQGKLTVAHYLYEIKNHISYFRLYDKYGQTYYTLVNFIAKYISKTFLFLFCLNSYLVFMLPSYIAYFTEPDAGYTMWTIIFWTPISIIAISDVCAHIIGIFRFWTPTLLYLRYQFKQVYDEILEAIDNHDLHLLKKSISDHNYCCKKTFELNTTFNYFLLIFYVLAKHVINISIYLSFFANTETYTRFGMVIMITLCFSIIFLMNLLCASVSACAHRPNRVLFQLSQWKPMSIRDQYSVMLFIEKLGGPDIGFYCYKLYPVNNYQFYIYICDWMYNYILVVMLIEQHLIN